jgi:hypothetical protein
MWTCPKCERSFTRRAQPHSCGNYSEERFLEGATETTRDLYERFKEEIESIAPFLLAPAKRRMGFQTRRIFAAIDSLGKDHLGGYIILNGEYSSPKFTRVTRVCETDVTHHFRIGSVEFFDEEFHEWLQMAFEYGG